MFLAIRKAAIYIFIASVIVFSIVSILAVWNVFTGDVLSKAFNSLIVITISLLLIVGAVNWRLSGTVISAKPSMEPVSLGRLFVYIVICFLALSMILGFISEFSRY